jgi:hypothetical protein
MDTEEQGARKKIRHEAGGRGGLAVRYSSFVYRSIFVIVDKIAPFLDSRDSGRLTQNAGFRERIHIKFALRKR